MASKGFSLDFKGFLDFARKIDERYAEQALLNVTEDALAASKDYVNSEIERAMENSTYNFAGGYDPKSGNYSKGDVKRSLENVKKMPIEVTGTVVKAYAGIDLSQASEEILFIIYGAPHTPKDTKLYNAVKVKGKVKTEVMRLQRETFKNALGDKYIGGRRR